jgi:CheY-like chemotaxis protein
MTTESTPVVLVADDEPSMLALVGQHIKTMGYTVLEASDGEQAWSLAQEHLPDLVILDVMMPGMSGWEVCRKIREDVALAHTAIIMLTGIGENLNELTSPLYGADSYIDKPFAFSELDDKVRGALHKHGQGPGLARTEPGDDEPSGNGGREHRLITTPPTESGPPVPDDMEEGWTGNEHPEVVNGHDESVMLVKTESLAPEPEGRRSALRPPSGRKSQRTHRKAAPAPRAKPAAKAKAKPAPRTAKSNGRAKPVAKSAMSKPNGRVKPAAKSAMSKSNGRAKPVAKPAVSKSLAKSKSAPTKRSAAMPASRAKPAPITKGKSAKASKAVAARMTPKARKAKVSKMTSKKASASPMKRGKR